MKLVKFLHLMRDNNSFDEASLFSKFDSIILCVIRQQFACHITNKYLTSTYKNIFFFSAVCQSMDIRNNADKLNRLKGCRVIEGFLQILLIDGHNESSYQNLTFPDLREITGYLLLYRVTGIKTLATLFPNLAVIRGHKTFNDYSLVIYDMKHMEVRSYIYF